MVLSFHLQYKKIYQITDLKLCLCLYYSITMWATSAPDSRVIEYNNEEFTSYFCFILFKLVNSFHVYTSMYLLNYTQNSGIYDSFSSKPLLLNIGLKCENIFHPQVVSQKCAITVRTKTQH